MHGGVFSASEIILEVQFGEGGDDSKLFVHDLFGAYCKYAVNKGFKVELLATGNGLAKARIKGEGVGKAFQYESGKHCVQRIPPTESKGRKQTSMVTVAVLPVKEESAQLNENDLEITTQKGHGPGGQHQNKTESAVRVRHIPTGIEVFINGRDQHANKRQALEIIKHKVNEHYRQQVDAQYNGDRKEQRDGGGRSNKIRTYNFLNDRAVDHRFNVKCGDVRSIIDRGRFDRLLGKIEE